MEEPCKKASFQGRNSSTVSILGTWELLSCASTSLFDAFVHESYFKPRFITPLPSFFCSMRKWRAANRDKNKRNDLRCRVYRLARQKFQDEESMEKELFIRDQINRRLGRQRLLHDKNDGPPMLSYSPSSSSSSSSSFSLSPSPSSPPEHGFYFQESLPFYNAPHHQIVLPSLRSMENTGHGLHNKVHLPPLQHSPWKSYQSSPLGHPLLLQPNPINISHSLIPVKLTL